MKTILFSAFFLLSTISTSAQEVVQAPSSPEKIVQFKNGNLYGFRGFISEKVYVAAKFEKLDKEYSNFMEAQLNGKKGFINGRGETLVPFEFDRLKKPFPSIPKDKRTPNNHFSWFLAQKDGKWGGVDSTGKWVVPPKWSSAEFVNDTVAMFVLEDLVRVESPSENKSKEPTPAVGIQTTAPSGQAYFFQTADAWSWASEDFYRSNLLIKIEKNGKTGVINHRGKVVAPVKYDQLLWCTLDGYVCLGNKDLQKTIYNKRGEQIAPLQLAEMQSEGRGLFWVVKDRELGKTGLIDTTGRTVMNFEFAECRLVREEDGFLSLPYIKARRLKEKLYAIYNLEGKQLTEAIYQEPHGNIIAQTLVFAPLPDNTWHLLGPDGKPVSKALTHVGVSGEVIVAQDTEGKNAFLRFDGTQLTEFLYTTAKGLRNDYQRNEFAIRIGLKDHYALIGEASKPGVPQLFIDKEGKEWVLPKQ
ncbi:MAG: WG repeat-containing protein [Saprospiraceae bacterium]|nr:WG repeat-containing protein [Saprospiraceae bacterium]